MVMKNTIDIDGDFYTVYVWKNNKNYTIKLEIIASFGHYNYFFFSDINPNSKDFDIADLDVDDIFNPPDWAWDILAQFFPYTV